MALPKLVAYNAPYGLDQTAYRQYMHGLIVWTAQAYVAGGLLPSYATIADQSGALVPLATLNVNPDTVWIQSISGSGFIYGYNKASGKIQIFVVPGTVTPPQPLIELAAGALPASVISDVVEFEAEWIRQ